MLLTKPSYRIEFLRDAFDVLESIESAGRTCYKSERKEGETSSNFVRKIMKRGHLSVIEHESMRVRFICDRGVSHEMVRHRLASYSQESTRYCNYGHEDHVTFVIPPWLDLPEGDPKKKGISMLGDTLPSRKWVDSCARSEEDYFWFLNHAGWKAQQARDVLIHSVKTEVVMTCNLREWLHVFNLRNAPAAHPQMRELMEPLHETMKVYLPEIFGEI